MCGECFDNTFVIVLAFVKYANTEEEKSYLANCEKPDDFYCFALMLKNITSIIYK